MPKPTKKVRKAKRKRKPKAPSAGKVVDVLAYLFEHVLFDPATRTLVYPRGEIKLEDLRLKISVAKLSYQVVTGDDLVPMAHVGVMVLANPHGRTIAGHTSAAANSQLEEHFAVRTIGQPTAKP